MTSGAFILSVTLAFWEAWGMSTICIERTCTLGEQSAREQLAEVEPMLRDRYGIQLAWQGSQAKITGSGVSGTVHIGADRVRVELKLGLLLRPLAGKIRGALEAQLDKALG